MKKSPLSKLKKYRFRILSGLLFCAFLVSTWFVFHRKPTYPEELHISLQNQLKEIIKEALIRQKPQARNFQFQKIWTQSTNKQDQISAHFKYSFDDETGANLVIEGQALMNRKTLGSSTEHELWSVDHIEANNTKLDFKEPVLLFSGSLKAEGTADLLEEEESSHQENTNEGAEEALPASEKAGLEDESSVGAPPAEEKADIEQAGDAGGAGDPGTGEASGASATDAGGAGEKGNIKEKASMVGTAEAGGSGKPGGEASKSGAGAGSAGDAGSGKPPAGTAEAGGSGKPGGEASKSGAGAGAGGAGSGKPPAGTTGAGASGSGSKAPLAEKKDRSEKASQAKAPSKAPPGEEVSAGDKAPVKAPPGEEVSAGEKAPVKAPPSGKKTPTSSEKPSGAVKAQKTVAQEGGGTIVGGGAIEAKNKEAKTPAEDNNKESEASTSR